MRIGRNGPSNRFNSSSNGSSSPFIRKPSLFNRSQRRRNSLATPIKPCILLPIRLVIVLLVFWFEYGTFWSHTSSCSFNDFPSTRKQTPMIWDPTLRSTADIGNVQAPASSTIGEWKKDMRWKDDRPHHVLIVSDPQILDMRSYPGRNWFLRYLGIKFTDAYIRKAWRFVRRAKGESGGLDSVAWLGDLLDSGTESFDKSDYQNYVTRFFRNFPTPRNASIPTVFVPGNHDLGLHMSSNALSSYGRERFHETFGPANGQVQWGGWDVTWVDAMALLEEGSDKVYAKTWVESIAAIPSTRPRLLLTHIPLFRPEGTFCGQDRESKNALRQGSGKNYQNELDLDTTRWLVETLKPALVYSGDDHDSCIVSHPYQAPDSEIPVIETTVKAFSMAMGVRRPGYHLLSLYPPKDPTTPSSATYTQTNCTLPDQISIWLHVYLPLYLLLVLGLFFPKIYRISLQSAQRHSTARSNGLPVHRHRKTLSRTLLGSRTRSEDDLNDEDEPEAQFPSFSFLSTPADEYAYNSSLDSEDLPTSNHSRRSSIFDDDDDEEEAIDSGNKIRRVSRVYMWENGHSPFADFPPTSPITSTPPPPSSRRLLSSTNSSRNGLGHASNGESTNWEGILSRLGPLHRNVLKPLLRTSKKTLQRIWFLPHLIDRIEARLLKTKLGEAIVETAHQVFALIWPGLALWCLVWFYFSI